MTRIQVIGIGAGNPEQITVEAINALNRTDVLFVIDKEPDLVALRREVVARYAENPPREVILEDPPRGRGEAAVRAWRSARARLYGDAVRAELRDSQTGAFLVWGDPALYDSTLAVLDEAGVAYNVIPAISSVQMLAAAHRITLNRVGRPVTITPARRLAETAARDDIVVMLDSGCAFLNHPDADIYWGAYLGTPDEILRSGRVEDVGPDIQRVRDEARERKGWMFDTYLLRFS